jgi:hypothetical protein
VFGGKVVQFHALQRTGIALLFYTKETDHFQFNFHVPSPLQPRTEPQIANEEETGLTQDLVRTMEEKTSYSLADLHHQYKKYIHKRPKYILL